jgi:hypothetical protein
MCLARQIHPKSPNKLYNAYLKGTTKPHGYLLLDLAQDTEDRLRFRTCIFPDEYPPTFYVDVNDETDKIELSRPQRTQISTAQITESHNLKRKPRTNKQYKRMRSNCTERKFKSVRMR